MRFVAHPFGPHPWSGATTWRGPSVLQLHRAGDWYSVWKLMDGAELRGWRVNYDEPVVRDANSFDVNDLQLDLLIAPDGTLRWKDVEDLAPALASGRMDRAQLDAVLEAAANVADALERGNRWWTWKSRTKRAKRASPSSAHHRPHVRTEPRTETAVGSGDPIDELQHLTTLVVDPKKRGADFEPHTLEVLQQEMHRKAPRARGAPHRVTDPHNTAVRRITEDLHQRRRRPRHIPGASKCEIDSRERRRPIPAADQHAQPRPGPPGCGP